MPATTPTSRDFTAARDRICEHIHLTPCVHSRLLGERVGAELYLKCENLQKTGSFKVRGALNKMFTLDSGPRRAGVVTVSAGNHAQAVAWAARMVGVPSTVVMPKTASPSKASASRSYGAEVVLHGTVADAFTKARELEVERGLTFLHPFDDPVVVAGQGTAGLEVLEQVEGATLVVVPVGGGGLISGMATAIKLGRPGTRVVGVEPTGACAMRKSLDAGHAVHLEAVHTIADGLAAPMAGELNYELVKRYVDDVVLVSDAEITEAMGAIMARAKLLTEPAGAAAVAALLFGHVPVTDRDRVVAVLSGGNVGLSQIATLAAEWRD